ncbi:hypothetical protein [Streptomyces sp. NPDC003635]
MARGREPQPVPLLVLVHDPGKGHGEGPAFPTPCVRCAWGETVTVVSAPRDAGVLRLPVVGG